MDNLVLVSFSGAHRTGKSTLIADVREALSSIYGKHTIASTPSFSSELFRRIREGEIKRVPFGARPESYDGLDATGIRPWFQRMLPRALAFEVERAQLKAKRAGLGGLILLVDRWFPDINAYTRLEDVPNRGLLERDCATVSEGLRTALSQEHRQYRHVSVFLTTRGLPVERIRSDQAGKFRATGSREEFEQHCMDAWEVTEPSPPDVMVQCSDQERRVRLVVEAVSRAVRESVSVPA